MKKSEYTLLEKYKEYTHQEEESEKNVIKGFDMLFVWSAVLIFIVIALKGFGSGSIDVSEGRFIEVIIISASVYVMIGYPLLLVSRIIGEIIISIYYSYKSGKVKKQM